MPTSRKQSTTKPPHKKNALRKQARVKRIAPSGKSSAIDIEKMQETFFHLSQDLICIAGMDGYFKYVNPAWERILGYTKEELLSRPFLEFIHPEDHKKNDKELAKLASGRPVDYENRCICKDGSIRLFSWTAAPHPEKGLMYCIGREITEPKRQEEVIRMYARQQAAVSQLGQRALSGIDLPILMEEAVHCVAEILGVEYAKILQLLPDRRRLLLQAGVGWKENMVGHVTVGAGLESQAGYTLASQEPVIVEDLRTETRFKRAPLLLDHRVVSGMSVIIGSGENPFGVLGAHATSYRMFSHDDINFLQSVANVLSTAICRNNAAEALRQSDERFKAIVSSTPDHISVQDRNLRYLFVVNPQLNLTEQDMLGKTDHDFLSKEEADELTAIKKQVLDTGTPAHLEKPLVSRAGQVEFFEGDLIPKFNASHNVDGLIGYFKNVTERKKLEKRQQLTAEIMRLLNEEPSQKDIACEIMQAIRQSTGIDACGIRLQEGEDYPYYKTRGFSDDFVESERYLCSRDEQGNPLRDSSGAVFLECMCGNILQGRTDPRFSFFTKNGSFWTNSTTELLRNTTEEERQAWTRNRCNEEGYESVALIPLAAGGQIIGLLQLNDRRRGVFNLDRIEFFEGLGLSIGIAVARAQNGQVLKQSEKRFRLLMEHANDAIIIVDDKGIIQFWNWKAAAIYGYSAEEIVGRPSALLVPERFGEVHERWLKKILADELELKEVVSEGINVRKDGSELDIESSTTPLVQNGEKSFILINRDVSERKRSDEALRESAEQLRSVMENANDAIFIVDDMHAVQYSNPKGLSLYGYRAEEILGLPISVLVPERFRGEHAKWWDRMLSGQTVLPEETNVGISMRKDGNEFDVETSTAAFLQKGKKRVVVIIRDISEQRRHVQELRRLSAAIDQAGEMVVVADAAGTIQYVNPAFEQITGYAKAEALGQNPRILKSGKHDAAFYQQLWGNLSQGLPWKGNFINRKKDGSLYDEQASISPVFDSSGTITNYVAVKRDITEAVRMGEQLRQAQKMDSIGTLAGGIAHDFNNILAAIIGNAEMAQQILPDYSTAHKHLEQVLKSSDRAKNLVKQILAFSRKSQEDLEPLEIKKAVTEVIKMLRSTLPATIEIWENIASDGWITGSAIQVHQVLLNLCTNAYHAMRERGGVLKIDVHDVNLDAEDMLAYHGLLPGDYVKLSVSDTGTGIAPDIIGRIFDPFFTTKEKGEGTGMGLSVVYGIVKSYGGDIAVESAPGRGTSIHVVLPQTVGKSSGAAVKEEEPLPRGNEWVLLVDDEEMIVDIGRKLLEMLGYRVTPARNGGEALELFQKGPDKIDLVITDYTMPGMTGYQLALKIIELRPDMPIILNTGFNETISAEKAKSAGIREFLLKPLNLRTIGEAVRRVLDGKK